MRSIKLTACLLAVVLFFINFSCQSRTGLIEQTDAKAPSVHLPVQSAKKVIEAKEKAPDTISVIGVGDVMLGTNFPDTTCLPPRDKENLLLPALEELTNATLTFGNMEGTILDSGGEVKKCKDPKVCYAFRMPRRLAPYLQVAGFDVMNMANNHSGDFGPTGRTNAMHILDSLGIGNCGLEAHPYALVERQGIKFGIIGFSPNAGTLDINKIPDAQAMIKDLRPKCDILIVSFHGGAEGRGHQHIPKDSEMFYGENRGDVYLFAHAAVDAGADVVLGHGPHVARAMEVYKDKFIAYSLGNFCTYNRFSLSNENGYAPLLKVFTDSKGNFLKAHISSYRQLGEGGPVQDKQALVYKRIATLTAEDFPDSKLNFSGNGWVVLKP